MELLKLCKKKNFFLLFISLAITLQADLPQDVKGNLHVHELPVDHPVRLYLNGLFKKSRFIANVDALKKAGFSCQGPRKHTGLIVAKHSKTPGFIYKIYTDVQEYYKSVPEYQLWLLRIEGARRIREYINERGWNDQFSVPQKWIYIIPESSSNDRGYYIKQTLLVEQDMKLRSDKKNLEIWKGEGISTTLLNQLYQIITDLGLRDCAKPDNIPFCYNGKIAFIDTQTFASPPVSYWRLSRSLSKSNRKFWINLTQDGR